MKLLKKTMLGFLLCSSLTAQLHANSWYDFSCNLLAYINLCTPQRTHDSCEIPCNKHQEYKADCPECNSLTQQAAQQYESEQRANKKNQDIPCDKHKEYRADCTECNKQTNKAYEQQKREQQAMQKNQDIPCGKPHRTYDPTCDRCNTATQQAATAHKIYREPSAPVQWW